MMIVVKFDFFAFHDSLNSSLVLSQHFVHFLTLHPLEASNRSLGYQPWKTGWLEVTEIRGNSWHTKLGYCSPLRRKQCDNEDGFILIDNPHD